MKKWAILTAFLLAGCGSSKAIILPDGRQGQLIDCSGAMTSIASCYQKAGQACPYGYDALDLHEEKTVPVTGVATAIMSPARSMMIACKAKQP